MNQTTAVLAVLIAGFTGCRQTSTPSVPASTSASVGDEPRTPVEPTSAVPSSTAPSAPTVTSDYTDLGATGCKATAESVKRAADSDYAGDAEGGDAECASIAPYRITTSYADMRSNLGVTVPGSTPVYIQSHPLGSDVAEAGFPYVSGKKLEWRSEIVDGKKVPFALIYRTTASVGDSAEKEFLQVVRLSPTEVCLIASVPGTSGAAANIRARELADTTARTTRCPP